ncbi:hypothetical protein B0H11DRAFT_1974758, partial [Mycena galericulata]
FAFMNTPLDHTYLPLEISIRLSAETRHTAFSSGSRNRSTFSSTPFSNNTRGSPPGGTSFSVLAVPWKRRRLDTRPRAESSSASSSSIHSPRSSSSRGSSLSSASSISFSSGSSSGSASASLSSSSIRSTSSSSSSGSFSGSSSGSSSSSHRSSSSQSLSHASSSTISVESTSSTLTTKSISPTTSSASTSTSVSSIFTTTTSFVSSEFETDIPTTSPVVFTSTRVVTSGGTVTTVLSTGVLGTGPASRDSFAHNVGGIVGVAIGGVVALILAVTIIFFASRRFKKRHRRGPRSSAEAEGGAELAAIAGPATATPGEPTHAASPGSPTGSRSSYHYTLRRPTMPPTPPSSGSMAGLLGRFRGGRGSRVRAAPGEFQGAAANANANSAAAAAAAAPVAGAGARAGSARTPTSPPGSPQPPGSLLNPRIQVAGSAPSLAPEWVGWSPPPGLPTPDSGAGPEPAPGTPTGLLRPSLAVLQFQSSRTLDDHEDYSRPIGGGGGGGGPKL